MKVVHWHPKHHPTAGFDQNVCYSCYLWVIRHMDYIIARQLGISKTPQSISGLHQEPWSTSQPVDVIIWCTQDHHQLATLWRKETTWNPNRFPLLLKTLHWQIIPISQSTPQFCNSKVSSARHLSPKSSWNQSHPTRWKTFAGLVSTGLTQP